ncbi:probable prolyl 4-hydroxylase 10 isoform X2 [Rhodamnia argentea]|uniref:Probable prolyl 4-hydroxylase 10 isoform X2 n=1 Tax=Rhodamnia argentea TaxID=178133 RepID=A0ABM3HZA7_9MYRT|nr:probable prolyl 4-hydroxylase 10 isoform X2 [Rhodamnia argentea]
MAEPRHPRFPQPKPPSSQLLRATLLIFRFVVLILLVVGACSFPSSSGGSSKANELSSILRMSVERSGLGREGDRGEQWVELISWEPIAFVYHNFLSEDECIYLIELAKPHMHKSTVVDSSTGEIKDNRFTYHLSSLFMKYLVDSVFLYNLIVCRVRTSSVMYLTRGRDKIIGDIEKRIADFTFIPAEHGEELQILHYEVGQKYEPHYDYFLDEYNTRNGGQRIATVVISDVEEGGETVFPAAKGNLSAAPRWNGLSDCRKKGLSIKPKMGDALLFWNTKPDGALDESSFHGGCPVIKGNKWSSTKWLRVHEYKI